MPYRGLDPVGQDDASHRILHRQSMWSSMVAVNAAFREHARRLASQNPIRQKTCYVDTLRAASQLLRETQQKTQSRGWGFDAPAVLLGVRNPHVFPARFSEICGSVPTMTSGHTRRTTTSRPSQAIMSLEPALLHTAPCILSQSSLR